MDEEGKAVNTLDIHDRKAKALVDLLPDIDDLTLGTFINDIEINLFNGFWQAPHLNSRIIGQFGGHRQFPYMGSSLVACDIQPMAKVGYACYRLLFLQLWAI